MKTKTHFAFRVDIWDDTGDSIVEHVAGADDFEVAEATYRAAIARWPAARITLRQGARIVHESRLVSPIIALPLSCSGVATHSGLRHARRIQNGAAAVSLDPSPVISP
jgi:hypothetical protein